MPYLFIRSSSKQLTRHGRPCSLASTSRYYMATIPRKLFFIAQQLLALDETSGVKKIGSSLVIIPLKLFFIAQQSLSLDETSSMKKIGSRMKRFLKGKTAQQSSANKGDIMDDLDVKLGNTNKSVLRTPRLPDQHNEVFRELLLEQYLCGNINDGILRRDMWKELVCTLNRRVERNYSESTAQIRFKNMKADFCVDNLKLAKFRRNPFHQYDIFEKICGDNIVVGTLARSSRRMNNITQDGVTGEEVEEDVFLSGNGVNFIETDLQTNQILDGENTEESPCILMSHSKRSSDDDISKSRRPSRRAEKEKLSCILDKHCGKTDKIIEKIDKICPFTTTQCLAKLGSIENILMEAIIVVHEALFDCNDHKIALMT
ncbi:hypothetical protein M5K25_007156 [Dendrobium thyrsiflorum]|uniref:MADF domain-containing protein n=1 Tax=Dendrobium thyrsiflorum TaxID=117978 RepID=A0ABD0VK38_DENTH